MVSQGVQPDAAQDPIAPITTTYHATSEDGLNFTTTGSLQFVTNPFAGTPPLAFGAAKYPPLYFPKIGQENGGYTLLTWTNFDGTTDRSKFGAYSADISANDLGSDPNNLLVTHRGAIGPVGSAPASIAGQTAGPWGLADGKIYFENKGFLGRGDYTDHGYLPFPSTVSGGPFNITGDNLTDPVDLIHPLGMNYCLDANTTNAVYPENHGSVIDAGNGQLLVYYSLRNCADSSRVDKEVYLAASADGGVSWSYPFAAFLSEGANVTIDGAAPGGNFSDPEAVLVGTQRLLYFNAKDANGNFAVVGSALNSMSANPVPRRNRRPSIRQFGTLLSVTLKDSNNNPMQGVQVTFTAPGASGASGLFANNTNTTTAVSDPNGVAIASTFTANSHAGGPYNVVASAAGLASVSFALINNVGAPSQILANPNTTPQSTQAGQLFGVPLSVAVLDAGGNAVPGVQVTFTAPAAGPSGVFSNNTGSIMIGTNSSGTAVAPFTANTVPGGPYNVTAASTAGVVNFALHQFADVSALVQVTQSGFVYNRATQLWLGTLTVTNSNVTPVLGPVQVELTNITAGVTMMNSSGTKGGNPYITVTAGPMAAGASAGVVIQFKNPSSGYITYTPVTYSGGL